MPFANRSEAQTAFDTAMQLAVVVVADELSRAQKNMQDRDWLDCTTLPYNLWLRPNERERAWGRINEYVRRGLWIDHPTKPDLVAAAICTMDVTRKDPDTTLEADPPAERVVERKGTRFVKSEPEPEPSRLGSRPQRLARLVGLSRPKPPVPNAAPVRVVKPGRHVALYLRFATGAHMLLDPTHQQYDLPVAAHRSKSAAPDDIVLNCWRASAYSAEGVLDQWRWMISGKPQVQNAAVAKIRDWRMESPFLWPETGAED